MKLSDNKLAKPNLVVSLLQGQEVSCLEQSFLSMDDEQIQQWNTNGVLMRALNGNVGQRKDYATTLPYFLLACANQSRRKEGDSRSYEYFDRAWRQLRSMSKMPPSQQTLDLWLMQAASLPLANELLQAGANPHGEIKTIGSTRSPFVSLVHDYLGLLDLKGKHRLGWPKVSQELAETRSRLLSWVQTPGMSSEAATETLGPITRSALLNHLQEDDVFLRQIRDHLVLRGAQLDSKVLGVFDGAVVPKALPSSHPRTIRAMEGYEKQRAKRENYRTGTNHRTRIVEWADALSVCDVRFDDVRLGEPWLNIETWKRWLCLPGSHVFAAHLANTRLNPWKAGKTTYSRDFLLAAEVQDAPILLNETVLLEKKMLAREINPMPMEWKRDQATEFLRSIALQPTEQVQKLFEWVNDVYPVAQDIPDDLTRAWFRSRIKLSVGDTAAQASVDLVKTLEWLHAEGRLGFMIYRQDFKKQYINIVGHVLEGKEEDLDMVNSEWSTWLQKPEFRSALLDLPQPYTQRVKTLSAFFPLPLDDRSTRLGKIQEAIELNSYVQGELRVFMHICSKRKNASLSDRLMRWEDITSINHIKTTPETSWSVLSQSFTPDVASSFSLDDWRKLLDYQQERFPLAEGPLITIKALLDKESRDPRLSWSAMTPLVDEMVSRGLDALQLPPMHEPLDFAQAVEAVRQAAVLSCDTAPRSSLSRRHRL